MTRDPRTSRNELAALGTANLERVVAIDSQSDERSETIPSTAGQRRLSEDLSRFFSELGFATETDALANLLVNIPGNTRAPSLALLVHMDTSRGTQAVPRLERAEKWDGTRL